MESSSAAAVENMPKQEAVATEASQVDTGAGEDGGREGRSHSKSSSRTSSTPPAPSRQQLARTMRGMQDDIEDHSDAISELRKQVLWSMSQQVRSERLVTGRQLVFQGFAPTMEDRNLDQAMAQRDQWILKTLQDHTQLSAKRLAFTASHATAVEALSRLTIVTLQEASVAALAARALHGKRLLYSGATVSVRRQQAAYDRLTSAPAKASMDILTRFESKFQSNLRPNWKDGVVMEVTGATPTILLKWVVNPERARIKLFITPKYLHVIEEQIDMEIRKLQFGSALGDQKGGSDMKGAGKGKSKRSKKGIPVDTMAFKQEPEPVREGLASLSFARFPFNISVRPLEMDGAAGRTAMHVDQEGQPAQKRQAAQPPVDQSIKRRSPTPSRDAQKPYHQQPAWGADPWASYSQHATPSSSSARPPRPDESQAAVNGGGAEAVHPQGADDREAAAARIGA